MHPDASYSPPTAPAGGGRAPSAGRSQADTVPVSTDRVGEFRDASTLPIPVIPDGDADAASAPSPWTVLVAARPPATAPPRALTVRRVLLRLAVGLVAALISVVLLATFASQFLAEREAVNDAANVADVLAEAIVQPRLTNELINGDPSAIAAFDDAVLDQMVGASVVRVKVWSADGVVLYADEPQLIGASFELDDEQLQVLTNPQTRAEITDLSNEENVFEPGERLVEVYRPVWGPDGQQLLFEIYLPYEPVAVRSADLWRGFTGVTTSALLLLVALTAPIVWSLLKRLRVEEQYRVGVLQSAVDASDAERRRIAGTLHDGPVQELIATSYAAENAAQVANRRGDDAVADQVRDVASSVRGNIRVLRSLLVDIYPAGIAAAGIGQALDDLAAMARAREVDVHLHVDRSADDLTQADQQLIHRVAQEALRNIVKHAAPCRATIRVERTDAGAVLEISDDGPGFDSESLHSIRSSGHLGTRVMLDLAADARAELSVNTAPGAGTSWRLRIAGSAEGTG